MPSDSDASAPPRREVEELPFAPLREASPPQLGRLRELAKRPVNLDGLAMENPALGLVALSSPADPAPSLVIRDGRVVELDGKRQESFDIIDTYVAAHGIDLEVAAEAMALEDVAIARMALDPAVPRAEVARLCAGLTPAKLARVVALLEPAELILAIHKMRVRRTPSNQAHVTNRLDDPVLLAADAATAVAYGFRELETTVPVLADAPSNALAVLIGSQVGVPGALTQCSVEEARELDLGMRGLTTYAETVSLYGTESVFIDGDDTPWSKAFLASAYASRGLKMRVTSGAGAEVLMGGAEGCSMLYLEARCVVLARAIGSQGVQNGGIDGASVAGSVPNGMRSLIAENLMVMLCDLESCSGNDTLVSESDMRRTAHSIPILLAGSDFIFSGFGSIPRYDNMFGPSNFNGEDLDDYLVLQRDWGVDGGLRPVDEKTMRAVRERGARAVQAVYRRLGLAEISDAHVDAAVSASGSKDLPESIDPLLPLAASTAILEQGVTALDVVAALAETGFDIEAGHVLGMLRARVVGDHLQAAAIFDETMQVLSKVTDPNDYAGVGSGYRMSVARRAETVDLPRANSVAQLLADQEQHRDGARFAERGLARPGSDPRDVVVGVSPAFGVDLWMATSGLPIVSILREVLAGLEEEGCSGRVVRIRTTIDLGLIGLEAARLSGSGIGIGLQAKGTALIHRRDLAPLQNLELYSVAPLITPRMYRQLGQNAGRHARGVPTIPVRNAYSDAAITARYHALTVALVSVERDAVTADGPPVELCSDGLL